MTSNSPAGSFKSLTNYITNALTPRTSLDEPRSRPDSPSIVAHGNMPKPTPQTLKIASKSVVTESSAHKLPTVRWLGGIHPQPSTSRTSNEGTADEHGLDADSEASEALREAILDEPFIPPTPLTRPPQAHLAPIGRPFKQPALVDQLARTALPTVSTAYPMAGLTIKSPQFQSKSPTLWSSQPPPSRTRSVDALKSLSARDREIHTSATAHNPAASTSTRWWFQNGNKDEVDTLLGPEDQADTAQSEAEHIRQKYLSPQNPVVFCHGLLGFDVVQLGASFAPLQISHWRGIKEVLEENGVEVLVTRVPATSSIHDRAKVLEERISETYPGRSVHLIGHSMGGLDCRYLTSRLKPSTFKVLSVTTIATPHRGSYFADYFLNAIGLQRIPQIAAFLEYLPNGGGDGKAFEMLTLEAMQMFNEETPNVDGVKYFSWGAKFEPGLLDTFKFPHSVILEKEGPNDGLVSVSSSQWGKYMGTLEDVNHLDLVGWINAARYKWAELVGKEIKFKPASFYLNVASMLAAEVEGLTLEEQGKTGESQAKPQAELDKDGNRKEPERTIQSPGID